MVGELADKWVDTFVDVMAGWTEFLMAMIAAAWLDIQMVFELDVLKVYLSERMKVDR